MNVMKKEASASGIRMRKPEKVLVDGDYSLRPSTNLR